MNTKKYNLTSERTIVPPHKIMKFATTILPTKVDLRSSPNCPQVYDQGELGSCTANAGCNAYRFLDKTYAPSRLFLYYNERAQDGDIPSDAGSSLSECVRALETFGVCKETTWPYNISKFAMKPLATAFTEAKQHMLLQAHQVNQNINDMKSCLASGSPFILGILVYASFESVHAASTGIIPMPAAHEQLLGGHAVLCVGYDDSKQWWIIMNSWGSGWGAKGFFYLPYAYLTTARLASDFWALQKVTPEPSK